MRVYVYFLCVLSVWFVAACRRQPPQIATAREDAYRANNLGVALLEQFKYPEAAAAFRRSLGVDPSLAIASVARVNLSLALLYAQDLEGAAREAAEGARLLPSAPQPPYVLGLVARAENRDADALRFFERVRQLDPQDVGTAVNIGQIHLQNGKYADAITVLRPAVVDEPYNVTAVYSLGLALTRAGQRDDGQRTLEAAQTLRTKGYAVTFGTSYLEQGRYAEAIASTGAEPELVDQTMPRATLTPVAPAIMTPAPGTPASSDPSPFGRSFSAGDIDARRLAASLGGGMTLIDFDGDGDFNLFATFPIGPTGQRLFRNDARGGVWSDVTAASGLGAVAPDAVPIGAVAGDYDNDGMSDLFVLAYGGNRLYHNEGNGRFRDVTAAVRLPPYPSLPGAAAFADVDHDGDLDLVIAGLADVGKTLNGPEGVSRAAGRTLIFPRDFAPAPVQLLRNNGNGASGTWTDITRDARLQVGTHAIAIVPTDFDNRRDTDLLIVNRDLPPMLFQNMRDGTFRDVAAPIGLAGVIGPAGSDNDVTAVAAGDVNKDDFPDFFFARARGGILALSDRRARYTLTPAPDGSQSALTSQFVDYDNDGLVDLLTWSSDGPHVFRNLGQRWENVTSGATAGGASLRAAIPARGLALADLDGDGNTDVVAGGASSLVWWRNSGDGRNHALRVQLKGRVSNRLGVGSKIQVRAGSLFGRLETSATTPAIASADLVFGLGARTGADVVRLLWPSGILQAEAAGAGTPGATATLPSSISIEELDRKPSSCPFLFTWNGRGFEFITDFMGGGEMGYWEGPGQHNRPDPVEYVRIRGDQLQPKNGRFDLRVTNELEETLYADRFALVAIAHPRDIDVFPDEGLTEPPKRFRLFAVRDERAAARVVDDHGHDVTETVARIDRRYPDDFTLAPFRGYAAQHTLTIDLTGPTPDILLLTAWTDYAFSSDNMAAHQAGLTLSSPSLQIKDAAGTWRMAVADIGIPVGRPQTIVVDLAGRIRPGEHEVRIVTNMRIYWDRILVATSAPSDGLRIARIDQQTATLGSRGFSAVVRPDGKEPESYDYERVTTVSPWKAMPGRYTREGDVHELLARSDDMFAVAKPGDEIALSFDAAAAGPLPDGWTRTFLLMADGFSKEMDINSASPDEVEPLPFHAMTQYPYSGREHYPDTIAHRAYREAYNTRIVTHTIPTLIAPGSKTKD